MRHNDQNCPVCRLMRSFAFSGLGMAIGSGTAYLMGASKENIMMSGVVVAAILVFGMLGKKKK